MASYHVTPDGQGGYHVNEQGDFIPNKRADRPQSKKSRIVAKLLIPFGFYNIYLNKIYNFNGCHHMGRFCCSNYHGHFK